MAVFRYKMQGILDIKEKLEDRAKQEFAEANMRLDAEKKKLDELHLRSCISSCNAALAFSTALAARAISFI